MVFFYDWCVNERVIICKWDGGWESFDKYVIKDSVFWCFYGVFRRFGCIELFDGWCY